MKNTKLKLGLWVILLILFSLSALAIDFNPRGNVIGKSLYNVTGFVNGNFTNIYADSISGINDLDVSDATIDNLTVSNITQGGRSIIAPYFCVVDGNGNGDYTTVKGCVDALNGGQGTIYIKSGDYESNETLVPYGQGRIECEHRARIIYNGTGYLMKPRSSVNALKYEIKGCRFETTRDDAAGILYMNNSKQWSITDTIFQLNSTTATGVPITLDDACYYNYFDRIKITFGSKCIYFKGDANENSFIHSEIRYCTVGVQHDEGNNNRISFSDFESSPMVNGVIMNGGQDLMLLANRYELTGTEIYVNTSNSGLSVIGGRYAYIDYVNETVKSSVSQIFTDTLYNMNILGIQGTSTLKNYIGSNFSIVDNAHNAFSVSNTGNQNITLVKITRNANAATDDSIPAVYIHDDYSGGGSATALKILQDRGGGAKALHVIGQTLFNNTDNRNSIIIDNGVTNLPVMKFLDSGSNKSISVESNDKICFDGNTCVDYIKDSDNTIPSNWTFTKNYPAACPANSAITQLDDSVTCTDSWVNSAGDIMTGNLNMSGNNLTNLYEIDADDYIRIGTGSTSQGMSGGSNLLVNGRLEVDGQVNFDNAVVFGSLARIQDNQPLRFGSGNDIELDWSTAQSVDSFVWGMDGGRSIIFTTYTNKDVNHTHAAQDNPTIFIHSNTSADVDSSEWLGLTHNVTDGVIESGNGSLVLKAEDYIEIPDGALHVNDGSGSIDYSIGAGDVYVQDTLEVDGSAYLGSYVTIGDDVVINGNVNMTNNNITNIDKIDADNYIRVGTGVTSHSLSGSGNLLVSSKLEVNGQTEFDNTVLVHSLMRMQDGQPFRWGTGNDAQSAWGTANTVHTLVFGLGNTDKSIIFTTYDLKDTNFGYAAQDTPTIFIRSNETTSSHWLSLTHNRTDAIIDTGLGDVIIKDRLKAANYSSWDGSQGITNTTGFWVCTNSTCGTTCQLQVKSGLIVGCT